MLGLARPLIKPAFGALASAGLSFDAEKVLKKIFGKGFGPKEIELFKLAQKMTPAQKKEVERYLVGQGVVRGGTSQYGGFLGMLASIGVPLAIDLVKKNTRERLANSTTTSTSLPPTPTSKGKRNANASPPFFGTWDDYKKIEFKDTPLSNSDLRKWCDFLRIPIKGIFSRNEPKPLSHSPCIIILNEIWELIGCVVGVPNMARMSILIHLGFHHL